MSKPFLTANWKSLVMLNYRIDPALLQRYVPPGTELDSYEGQYFISMVGFQFHDTQVMGWKIPWHVNFDEVNLRFYIRRKTADGWRRAVAFIKEIVPRWAIATVARRIYNENYVALPMRSTVELPSGQSSGQAIYRWKLDAVWHELGAEFVGEPQLLLPDSEEAFITEHYWGYVIQRDQGLVEYEVRHPSWRVWRASRAWFHCDVSRLYGPEFTSPLSVEPASAFIAEGSAISVSHGSRIATNSRQSQ